MHVEYDSYTRASRPRTSERRSDRVRAQRQAPTTSSPTFPRPARPFTPASGLQSPFFLVPSKTRPVQQSYSSGEARIEGLKHKLKRAVNKVANATEKAPEKLNELLDMFLTHGGTFTNLICVELPKEFVIVLEEVGADRESLARYVRAEGGKIVTISDVEDGYAATMKIVKGLCKGAATIHPGGIYADVRRNGKWYTKAGLKTIEVTVRGMPNTFRVELLQAQAWSEANVSRALDGYGDLCRNGKCYTKAGFETAKEVAKGVPKTFHGELLHAQAWG